MAKSNAAETITALAVVGAVGLVAYLLLKPSNNGGGNAGSAIGTGLVNEVNGAIAGAANSAWNGSGTGPLDTWGNFFNFLAGNCDSSGNCSSGGS